MDEQLTMLLVMVESGGIFTPLAFILLHFLRQFFFIPVAVICIAGGILFGSVAGTFYSLIGLYFSSFLFFAMIRRLPKTHKRLSRIKRKWFGEYGNLTIAQITILRLVPFIHYHLLSFCLLEKQKNFKRYMKASFITNIPLALFYTVFGEFIKRFTPSIILIILFSLSILVYMFREKVTIIKWQDFFKKVHV